MAERNVAARAAPDADADRRESARVPVRLLVRDLALGGSFEARDGNLGLGGLFFEALHPPAGQRLEVRFLLPGVEGEVGVAFEERAQRLGEDGVEVGGVEALHHGFDDQPL